MATAPPPPAPAELDLAQLAATYVKIRDRRSEIKKAYEEEDDKLKANLETLEAAALAHLNAHGVNSVKTDFGTIFRQEEVVPSIADDAAFFAWVRENNAFDALHRRVSSAFVKEFMNTHEGGLPPPGLNVHRGYKIIVRRGS